MVPGVPAGFLFLLLATPLSKAGKGSEEGDGRLEVVLSSIDGLWGFGGLYVVIDEVKEINLYPVQVVKFLV